MTEVHFKFRENVDAAERRKAIARLRAAGARAVRPLFRGETDAELASLYRLEYGPKAHSRVRTALQNEDAVELSETAAPRRLIR